MLPVLVMPMHDPHGLMFSQLVQITPPLKTIFSRVYVSVTAITRENQAAHVKWLADDDFFKAIYHQTALPVGQEFLTLYTWAANDCDPATILHLAFIDRVAFTLQSQYGTQFAADITALSAAETPLIFQRSASAWATHPRNYYDLEQMMTRLGEWLFQKSLDFAWCHLVVQAGLLGQVAPQMERRDLSMMAELVVLLQAEIQTRAVDWLAWEDPFIIGREAAELKREREQSLAEIQKRLSYVIPTLDLLATMTKGEKP